MNCFEKFLYILQKEMETPVSYGWYHFIWIILVILMIMLLYKTKDKYNEKQLKLTLGIYSITALILETLKQLIWSFNYDQVTKIITWDYEWYSFPFQLCTTPIYVCLICFFLKNNKIRKSLLSYIAFITILGSLATIAYPESCFTSDILVNIHTMWLHCGSLVVSIYLIMTNEVELNIKNLIKSIEVFIIFIIIAQTLNITIYNSNILNEETFNMFYISPYFISSLPIFDIIQKALPYPLFLLVYITILILGSIIIYYLGLIIKLIFKKFRRKI